MEDSGSRDPDYDPSDGDGSENGALDSNDFDDGVAFGDSGNDDVDHTALSDHGESGEPSESTEPSEPGEPSESTESGESSGTPDDQDDPSSDTGSEPTTEFNDTFADGFIFDDDFVRAAEIKEPTADERQRSVRQANLQRLLRDSDAQQENLLHEYRRFAPPPDGDEYPHIYDDDSRFGESYGELYEDEFDEFYSLHPDDQDLWLLQRRRRRNRRILSAVSAIVIVSVVVVYALSQFFAGLSLRNSNSAIGTPIPSEELATPGARHPGDPEDADAKSPTRPDDWPPLGEWSATPLGSPAAVPAGGGAHAFLMLQKDGTTPVAYDPCREIHYVTTSTTNAPEGATRLIDDAIKTLSSITGLKFVDDGATKESPNDARPAFQPDRYGQRWAPVLISWSTASESPRLAVTTPDGAPPGSTVDVLGYAGSVSAGFTSTGSATVKAGEPKGLTVDSTEPGSAPRNRAAQDRAAQDQAAQDRAALVPWAAQAESTVSEDRVYVTGSLVLDSDNFTEMLAQFDGYARARATVLHELGHLVGLNHVGDANQLMTPSLNSSLTEFAAGDREGLAALGKGACMPEI